MNALERLCQLLILKKDSDDSEFLIKILRDLNRLSYRELRRLEKKS